MKKKIVLTSSSVFICYELKVIIFKMIRATFIGRIEDSSVLFEKVEREEDLEYRECKRPELEFI